MDIAEKDKMTESERITYEEVETWSVEALKDFCRKRNFNVTGSKKVLVARVYVLFNSNVPEEPGAKEQEASKKRDYKSLYMYSIAAPDPLKLSKWIGEKDGLRSWPPVTYIDIDIFMRKNGSVGLTTEGLTAYKTGKAFSYFACDWLSEVYYHMINRKHQCCYLKTTCLPSNRINDNPHSLWIKCMKSGEVLSAYCTCIAG
jgi:hypothetical protein